MTDITLNIAANADDGTSAGSSFYNSWAYAYIAKVSSTAYRSFFRFSSVTIPAGATIISAKIKLRASESSSGTPCNVNIYMEDADDPSAPSSASDLTSRPLTSAVAWTGVPAFTSGTWYDSPDLTSIVQDIIDRAGWASGNHMTVHIVDNSSGNSTYRGISCREAGTSYSAQLVISYDTAIFAESDDEIGLGDEISAFNLTDELTDEIGFSDDITAWNSSGYLTDEIGLGDEISQERESEKSLADEIGFSDSIENAKELFCAVADEIGFSDAFEAFNWSRWWAQNKSQIITRYYFTLTGDPDATTDIEIPISSFSARKRTGEDTYLSVVIPDYATWAAAIAARSNGEMVVEMAYLLDGEVSVREEILRADLEEINLFQGPHNRSIVLTGHKTQTFAGKVTTLEKSIYRGFQGGKLIHRFATADPYLDPGDTCKVDDDAFTVDNIVYMIDTSRATMEVRE